MRWRHRDGARRNTGVDLLPGAPWIDHSADMMTALFETCTDAVLLLRPCRSVDGHLDDFECALANPAATNVVGTDLAHALGCRLGVLLPGVAFSALETVLTTGEPLTAPWDWYSGADHRYAWVDVRRVVSGGCDCLMVMISDVTDARTSAALIGELQDRQRELELQALHDLLTGCANRLLVDTRLEHAIRRLGRHAGALAVFYLDTDGFKQVNDNYGHAAGDTVLSTIAQRLRAQARPYDTVGRLGGDEFVVVCEDIDHQHDVDRIAQRFLSACAQPFDIDGEQLTLSVSIGVAIAESANTDATTLIDAADAAMYRAKSGSGGRIAYADQAVEERMQFARGIKSGLADAIEKNHLTVGFEPVVRTADGQVFALQSSARWKHPFLGYLNDETLVMAAHDIGIGPVLTNHIMDAVLPFLSSTATSEPRPPVIVNVSGTVLCDNGFVERMRIRLHDGQVRPGSLWIAIDGAYIARHHDAAKVAIGQLAELGVRIVRDNTGAPGSPLTYFEDVHIDYVRIDAALVAGLAEPEHQSLIGAISDAMHAAQRVAIADGVTSEAAATALEELGIGHLQGSYITRTSQTAPASPVPD